MFIPVASTRNSVFEPSHAGGQRVTFPGDTFCFRLPLRSKGSAFLSLSSLPFPFSLSLSPCYAFCLFDPCFEFRLRNRTGLSRIYRCCRRYRIDVPFSSAGRLLSKLRCLSCPYSLSTALGEHRPAEGSVACLCVCSVEIPKFLRW